MGGQRKVSYFCSDCILVTQSIYAYLPGITQVVAGPAILHIGPQVNANPMTEAVVGMTHARRPVAGFDFRTRMIAFPAMTIVCPQIRTNGYAVRCRAELLAIRAWITTVCRSASSK